jgi:hypothetical protein
VHATRRGISPATGDDRNENQSDEFHFENLQRILRPGRLSTTFAT